MPPLRRDALCRLGLGTGTRRPSTRASTHPDVVFARSSRRREETTLNQGRRAELDAVALAAGRRTSFRGVPGRVHRRCEVGLGGRDEAVALVGDRLRLVRGESWSNDRTANPCCCTWSRCRVALVQLRRRRREPLACGAVREQAVVELVRRSDALPLDRLGDAVRAVRDTRFMREEKVVVCLCMLSAARAAVTYLPAQPVTSRLLPLP